MPSENERALEEDPERWPQQASNFNLVPVNIEVGGKRCRIAHPILPAWWPDLFLCADAACVHAAEACGGDGCRNQTVWSLTLCGGKCSCRWWRWWWCSCYSGWAYGRCALFASSVRPSHAKIHHPRHVNHTVFGRCYCQPLRHCCCSLIHTWLTAGSHTSALISPLVASSKKRKAADGASGPARPASALRKKSKYSPSNVEYTQRIQATRSDASEDDQSSASGAGDKATSRVSVSSSPAINFSPFNRVNLIPAKEEYDEVSTPHRSKAWHGTAHFFCH